MRCSFVTPSRRLSARTPTPIFMPLRPEEWLKAFHVETANSREQLPHSTDYCGRRFQSNLEAVSPLPHIDALRRANLVAQPSAFVDVSAKQEFRLHAFHPLPQHLTPRMVPASNLIQLGPSRREVNHHIQRLLPLKRLQGTRNLLFRIFSRRIKGRGVAVPQPRPPSHALGAFQLSLLPVEVDEAVPLAQSACLLVRFMIARKQP